MPKVIKMSMKQWTKYIEDLGERFVPAMKRGMVSGAARCIPILHDATVRARPASPNGKEGAVDTGIYKAAWRSSSTSTGSKVFNTSAPSPIVEGGRRASAVGRDGIRNLEGWAKRKLRLNAKEAKDAAWAIAKTLKDRPLRKREVMGGSEDKMIKAVEAEITHELDVELRR